MMELFTSQALMAFFQVVMIDLVLAGDNAVVIGLAAAGLPAEQRTKAIVVGIAAATVMRIGFAGVTTQLLQIVGLLLAGGILLLWVCWKMWRELRTTHAEEVNANEALTGFDINADGTISGRMQRKTFRQAATQILIADVSMSLDNVLAVAGAANGNTVILIIGLAIAIVLMAVAANYIAKLLATYPWISWIGLAVIVYVALHMCWTGLHDIGCMYVPTDVCDAGLISTVQTLMSGVP